MQALIELLIGFIALLAALALSQFGVDLQSTRSAEREVSRVTDCRDTTTPTSANPGRLSDC